MPVERRAPDGDQAQPNGLFGRRARDDEPVDVRNLRFEALSVHSFQQGRMPEADPCSIVGGEDLEARALLHAAEEMAAALEDLLKQLSLVVGEIEDIQAPDAA